MLPALITLLLMASCARAAARVLVQVGCWKHTVTGDIKLCSWRYSAS